MSDKRPNQSRRGSDTVSPRDLAVAIGISESSVKRWVDQGRIEAARTAGGHRRIAVTEAVRFIRDSGTAVVHPESLGLAKAGALVSRRSADEAEAESLFELLHDGHALEVVALVQDLYLQGRSVGWIADGPVRSAMARLGELWQHGPAGIFREHRATEMMIQALNGLRSLLPRPVADLAAVGGAAPLDPYVLPSLAVATVLEAEGWRAVNLGARTDLRALDEAVDGVGPSLVWMSFSVPEAATDVAPGLPDLIARLAGREVAVVLGGRAAPLLDVPPASPGHVCDSLRELEAFVRGARSVG